jgi:hypothetical protein
MPAPDLIDVVQTLHDRGRCTNLVLDGVAETQLEWSKCEDATVWCVWGGGGGAMGVQ